MKKSSSFFSLSPDLVLTTLEGQGFIPTGEFYQLNSYENRVFNVRLEKGSTAPGDQVVPKFYRPHRWSRAALEEEHAFLKELRNEEVPVVVPLPLKNGKSLDQVGEIYFTVFPKTAGKMPDEFINNELEQVGQALALLHNVGARQLFRHRPTMGTENHVGWKSLDILSDWVVPELWTRYADAADQILDYLDDNLEERDFLRVHGDCHRGNILSNGQNFFFVDFDDTMNAPAVQDFWMLFPGEIEDCEKELDQFLTGYTRFREFDESELDLIPALRGLRICSYAAWIAQRWEDPSFPRLFPNFQTYLYWAEEVEALEKIAWRL